MRIFVTGATGFIGSHFVNAALEQGHEVVGIRRSGAESRIRPAGAVAWLEKGLAEVTARDFQRNDVLVHLAAAGVDQSSDNDRECFDVNVVQAERLLSAGADAGVSRVIFCGSCFEYGLAAIDYDRIPADAPLFPNGPYHASKAAASQLATGWAFHHLIPLAILRPFHVYGPGEGPNRFWPSLWEAAASGRDFPMTDGGQVRDFTPVLTVASRFLAACLEPLHGVRIENVGSGEAMTLLDFARREWTTSGAGGRLLPGAVPRRKNEVMRYVPDLKPFDLPFTA